MLARWNGFFELNTCIGFDSKNVITLPHSRLPTQGSAMYNLYSLLNKEKQTIKSKSC